MSHQPKDAPNKIALTLSAAERKLLIDELLFLCDAFTVAIQDTPADQSVQLTLDELEELADNLAAESNHTEDKTLGKKFDCIYEKIELLLDLHADKE